MTEVPKGRFGVCGGGTSGTWRSHTVHRPRSTRSGDRTRRACRRPGCFPRRVRPCDICGTSGPAACIARLRPFLGLADASLGFVELHLADLVHVRYCDSDGHNGSNAMQVFDSFYAVGSRVGGRRGEVGQDGNRSTAEAVGVEWKSGSLAQIRTEVAGSRVPHD